MFRRLSRLQHRKSLAFYYQTRYLQPRFLRYSSSADTKSPVCSCPCGFPKPVIETQVLNQERGAELHFGRLRPELDYNEAGGYTLIAIVTCTVVSILVTGIIAYLEDKRFAKRFEAHITAIGLSTADKNDLLKRAPEIWRFIIDEKNRIRGEIHERAS